MTTPNRRTFILFFLFAGMAILSGCRPSVREAVKVVSTIPSGVRRDDVRQKLVETYSEKVPKDWKHAYALVDPPRPVTKGLIESDRTLIAHGKKTGRYYYFQPSDLYEKLQDKAVFDMVGIVAEAAHGNGSLTIYYDSNTNYLGFFAHSTEKVK